MLRLTYTSRRIAEAAALRLHGLVTAGLIAVACLTGGLAVASSDDAGQQDRVGWGKFAIAPVEQAVPDTRFDGRPEEGSRGGGR